VITKREVIQLKQFIIKINNDIPSKKKKKKNFLGRITKRTYASKLNFISFQRGLFFSQYDFPDHLRFEDTDFNFNFLNSINR